ncbi:MAG: T9SS type A sorting domain-containing protein, partial [Saprospiraceae bacterium]|nr:T9SS type A sorting domain-containing protein [Saprospiraceae bacterium]
ALYLANVVQDGDTIEIADATYSGTACLAVWQASGLIIKGIGGRPQMEAEGQYIWGKGIWVLAGDNITVENIEFSGAAVPDQNGAGIRLDGNGMTVRHCLFTDNENGILTANSYQGDILIEFCEFGYNGYGDGYSHNLYIGHVNKLTFRHNYSHHAKVGHNLKSRAKENYILYNRIMDEQTGNSSRLIDLPNGGYSLVMGNLLMQGELAENNNLVGYGLEGLSLDGPHEFYLINNTMVNKRVASCLFVSVENGTEISNISNNILAGTGDFSSGPVYTNANNLMLTDIAEVGFVAEEIYDYRLTASSPAIDLGSEQPSLMTPDHVYVHVAETEPRPLVGAAIDLGAYEFGEVSAVEAGIAPATLLYPNPTTGLVFSKNKFDSVRVFDAMGRPVATFFDADRFDMAGLGSGLYFALAQTGGQGQQWFVLQKI